MKLKYTYTFQKYDDRYLAVVDFTETETERRMLWVNDCGKTILELLENELSREELLSAMLSRYLGDEAAIKAAVNAFLDKLSAADLLMGNQENE